MHWELHTEKGIHPNSAIYSQYLYKQPDILEIGIHYCVFVLQENQIWILCEPPQESNKII